MKHLDRIDVLRAVAILLVFLHHAQICLIPNYRVSTFDENGLLALGGLKDALLNLSPAAFGWTGVQLFLLISGFLIHLGFVKGEAKGLPLDVRSFLSKRFWRIYPPYLLTLLFFCFAVNGGRYLTQPDKVVDLVSHLFMVHNLSQDTFWAINPSLWSIALEIQLYLVYPLLLFIRKKLGMRRTLLLTLLMAGAMILLNQLGLPGNFQLSYKTNVFAFWYIWCAGAYLAEQYHAGRPVFPAGHRSLLICLVLFAAMGAASCVEAIHLLVVPLAVFAWMAFFEWFLRTPILVRWEASLLYRGLVTIGLCSYSIYLIHQPYLRTLLRYFGEYGNQPFALAVKVSVVFGVLFLISYALYQLVELPSIAHGARLRARRKGVAN